GDDGLDELTTADTSTVWVVHDGTVSQTVLDPADLGLPRSRRGGLPGGGRATKTPVAPAGAGGGAGPARGTGRPDARGAAGAAAGAGAAGGPRGEGVAGVVVGACARAAAALDCGASQKLLNRWVAASQRVAAENS